MASMKLSQRAVLSQTAYNRFAHLNCHDDGRAVATYVWVDTFFGGGEQVRAKSRVLDRIQLDLENIPDWSVPTPLNPKNLHGVVYEDILHPVAIFRDPFLGEPNKLILCEALTIDGKPANGNHRASCKAVMDKASNQQPWFGIEQEYFLVEVDKQLLGWPKNGFPEPMGPSHCGVGASRVFGRHIIDSHLRTCLYAGVAIGGTNAETVPAQWEFQVGPCEGIAAGDNMWMARYLLERVAEDFGVDVSFKPSPIHNGDWLGSGSHCNFSTKDMRTPGCGLRAMEMACEKLKKRHGEHLAKYDLKGGEENRLRLQDGFANFTWGVADRNASVRIPAICHYNKCGFIEDRRPAANADPYMVTEMLAKTICLDE